MVWCAARILYVHVRCVKFVVQYDVVSDKTG